MSAEVGRGSTQASALYTGNEFTQMDHGEDMTKTGLPASFETLIHTSPKPVLVDFWAEWCGPCRAVSPVVERLAKEYGGRMLTVKINVDRKPEIAAKYGIQSIPTIMLLWHGQVLMRQTGALPYDELKREVDLRLPVMN